MHLTHELMHQVFPKMLFLVIYSYWFLVKLHALHVLLHWYFLCIFDFVFSHDTLIVFNHAFDCFVL